MSATPQDDIVLPLHAEHIEVSRADIVRGHVTVSTRTVARDTIVDEMLRHENAEIERVAIGRIVAAMPDVREEGDTIVIPVVEEIVVVERRLLLKEEIRVRRVQSTQRHVESVTLRAQEAVILREPAQPQQPVVPETTA